MSQAKIIGLLLLALGIFGICYHFSRQFLDWLKFQSLGTRDYIVDRLAVMFIDIPPHQILIGLFSLSFGMGSMVFLSFLPNLLPGFVFGIMVTFMGWKAPKPVVDMMYKRRVTRFVLQMVDGLSLMSNGLKSGLSVVQAMALVAQEMPDPIKQEFTLILSQNKVGVSLEEAFVNLSKRIESEDVEMFVTSINILKETGGNLAETFDTIVNTIRERIKVENKIAALTAQGYYQGMFVMSIPPFMLVMLSQSDPEAMAPLFNTTLGWVTLFVIVFLEAMAFIVIRKIIKIDV